MRFNVEIVRQWLDKHERSQAWLARQSGCSECTMKNIMAHGHTPRLVVMGAIAKVIDIDIRTLILTDAPDQAKSA